MTGYDLYSQAAHIIATIESLEGADPDILDPQLAAWFDATDDKIAAYHAVIKRLETEDAHLKAEADAIAACRKRQAKQAERVKDLATLLLTSMEALGNEPKVKRPTFSAWLATTESVSAPDDATIDLPALGAAATIHTWPLRNLIPSTAKPFHTSGNGVALVSTPLQARERLSNVVLLIQSNASFLTDSKALSWCKTAPNTIVLFEDSPLSTFSAVGTTPTN